MLRTGFSPLLIVLLLIVLVGYVMPWVVNISGGLTFNAYDLAEWTSLHPGVRAESLALLTTFLLRLPMIGVGVVCALSAEGRWRLPALIAAALIAVALLPPLDFINALDNPNYRQQAFAAGLVLVSIGIRLINRRAAWNGLIGLVALTMLMGAIIGNAVGFMLMESFGLRTQDGIGFFITAAGCVCLTGMALLRAAFSSRRVQVA